MSTQYLLLYSILTTFFGILYSGGYSREVTGFIYSILNNMKQKLHGAVHAFLPHDNHLPKHPILKGFIAILGIMGLISMYVGSIGQNPVDAAGICDRPRCNDSTDQPWLRQLPSMIDNNGFKMGYYEYLPKQYASQTTRKFPLIIFLHGVGEGGNGTTDLSRVLSRGPPSYINQGFNFTFNVNGNDESFIVLSPQASRGWFSPSDVDQVIEWAKAKYRVDTERIYLMGLSAGGGGTWYYATNKLEYAKKLAAISPTCGASNPDPTNPDPGAVRDPKNIADANLPVRAFHGDADGTVGIGVSREFVTDINRYSPGLAKLKEYPGVGHNAWSLSMDPSHNVENPNVYEWFLQHRRSLVTNGNYIPVANAGSDVTIISPTTTASLTATMSTDSDGTITAYSWKQISGPNTATIQSPSAVITSLSNLAVGTYIFEVTVTDNKGATAKDQVSVFVRPTAFVGNGNGLVGAYFPNLSFTAPSTNVIDKTINFDWGNAAPLAAIPADGFTVRWEGQVQAQYSDTYTFYTIADDGVKLTVNGVQVINNRVDQGPTEKSGTITLVAGQKYSIVMEYYDRSGGATAKLSWSSANTTKQIIPQSQLYSSTTIIVTPPVVPNQNPRANAGGDQTITLPTSTVSLDASASVDPDGTVAGYAWKQLSGPSTSAAISNINAAKPTVSNLIAGTYTFEVTITDNKGGTGKDTVVIVVKPAVVIITPPSNPTPVVGNGNGLAASFFSNMTLANTPIVKNTVQTVDFDWAYGSPAGVPADGFSARFEGQIQAQYSQEYTFYTSSDDGVKLTVNGVQLINNWTDHGTTEDSAKITLVAGQKYNIVMEYYEKSGGAIARLSWSSANTVKQIIPKSQLYSTAIITTNPTTPNQNPRGNAGNDQTITLPTNSVVLDAIASIDPDGTIVAYSWKQIAGPSNATILATTTPSKATASSLVAGTYTFEVTITDNRDGTAKDTMIVVVKPTVSVVTPTTPTIPTPTNPTTNTAGRILIDIGSNADGVVAFKDAGGKMWNVAADGNIGLKVSNAIDSNNNPTSIGLSIINNLYGTFYGGAVGDGVNRSGYGSDLGEYPSKATTDSAFADSTSTNGQWKISGLDPNKTYSFKFRGSRYGDNTNVRGLKMKLTNESTWKDVSQQDNGDFNNAILFNGISGVSEVTFDIRVKDGAKYGYINLIDINYK